MAFLQVGQLLREALTKRTTRKSVKAKQEQSTNATADEGCQEQVPQQRLRSETAHLPLDGVPSEVTAFDSATFFDVFDGGDGDLKELGDEQTTASQFG